MAFCFQSRCRRRVPDDKMSRRKDWMSLWRFWSLSATLSEPSGKGFRAYRAPGSPFSNSSCSSGSPISKASSWRTTAFGDIETALFQEGQAHHPWHGFMATASIVIYLYMYIYKTMHYMNPGSLRLLGLGNKPLNDPLPPSWPAQKHAKRTWNSRSFQPSG